MLHQSLQIKKMPQLLQLTKISKLPINHLSDLTMTRKTKINSTLQPIRITTIKPHNNIIKQLNT